MKTHCLKIWPEPFAAVLDGRKRFEVRKDDRGFEVGDRLLLQEYDPLPNHGCMGPARGCTGRVIRVVVTYKCAAGSWGLPGDVCVLGISELGVREPAPSVSPKAGAS